MVLQELLDLGESVGTESRGLSEEQISLLPTARCKLTSFFSRKKPEERYGFLTYVAFGYLALLVCFTWWI